MVVGLDLHEDVDLLVVFPIDPLLGVRQEAPALPALDDGGVVAVGREHLVRGLLGGMADHAEEGMTLGLAVDDPARIEDLVAAMLRIRLGEHHQLHVGGIAVQGAEALHQVVDLVVRQGQSQIAIGPFQSATATRQQVHGQTGPRLGLEEEASGVLFVEQDLLGHAIVEGHRGRSLLLRGQVSLGGRQPVGRAPLDPPDLVQAAVVGDVRGLG